MYLLLYLFLEGRRKDPCRFMRRGEAQGRGENIFGSARIERRCNAIVFEKRL